VIHNSGFWTEYKLEAGEIIIGVYGSYFIGDEKLKTLGFILGK
jgi:hypothetical protein